MKLNLLIFLSLALLGSSSPFEKRGLEKCKNLQASSNNGGRKIAIVIDESGSMASSDPYDLRIIAGKQVNDWLVSSKEAGNGKSADLVSVIGFDDSTRLLYGLGDPGGADSVFSQITTLGGTYIAGGVDEAVLQLNKSGNDPTANRSGIVVLTDGSDSSTSYLVESINNAGQQGIRVSFGFLDTSTFGYGYQDPEVLQAIQATGGMYATINGDKAQNTFVNVMLVHGLTDNDNPSAPKNSTTVYNGLSVSFVLGNDGSSTLTYTAEAGEHLTFAISSVTAGDINVTATDAGGKQLGGASADSFSYTPEELQVTASSGGSLQLKVQGEADMAGGMFIVGVNSSIPLTNCTLGDVGAKSGLSTGAKAGIGIAIPIIAGLLGLGSYFAWKYWKGLPPKTSAPPSSYTPNQPPIDEYKQPYIQTNELPTPSPQPTNTHPGWAMPPPKFPQTPNKPQNNTGNPDNYNHSQPHYPNSGQPDLNQQPFNQSDPPHPPQTDPAHPTQADPSHPAQADPSHPTQADPSHPTQADPSHPSQADPCHPTQADPAHPTQADPSHPTQADPAHPTQADPSHPTQADPSHPTQADPSHPTQADPSYPTQADPYHPTQADPGPSHPTTDSNPAQPPQTDPNQPPQNPNDPHDIDPKRLKSPRLPLRFFGRRRKKDEEDENQHYNQTQPGLVGYGSSGYGTAPAPQAYTMTQTQPAYGSGSQHYQQAPHGQQVQYSVPPGGLQQHPIGSQGQYPPSQPYMAPMGPGISSQQPQQYQATPQGGRFQPQQPSQQGLIQQFPQPPPSAGNDQARHAQEVSGQSAYNVSPVLQHVELAQPSSPRVEQQQQQDIISPVSTGAGSISRKPVGGQ